MLPRPFLLVNPKSYLYGRRCLDLALAAEDTAAETGLAIYFTCPYADIRLIAGHTRRIVVCAQSMDPLTPGRGMGRVLPESLREAGARAVFLNHAENPKTVPELAACIRRAKDLGMTVFVCADSVPEARAVACLGADIVLAEPTGRIGTGQPAEGDYIRETLQALRAAAPGVQVMIGSGITTPAHCARVIALGADGVGATSGIVQAPSPAGRIREMALAIVRAAADARG